MLAVGHKAPREEGEEGRLSLAQEPEKAGYNPLKGQLAVSRLARRKSTTRYTPEKRQAQKEV